MAPTNAMILRLRQQFYFCQHDPVTCRWSLILKVGNKRFTNNLTGRLLFVQVTLMLTRFSHMKRALKLNVHVRQHFMTNFG